jgi:hypothetical protein
VVAEGGLQRMEVARLTESFDRRDFRVVQGSIARVRVSPLIVSVVDTVPIGTAAYVAVLTAVGMIGVSCFSWPGWR